MVKKSKIKYIESKEIFLSIKPKFAELIANRQKTHEFRKYQPIQPIKKIFFYITRPECILKYIAEVGEPINHPNKIEGGGIGNDEFNNGLKKSRFTFPILHLYELTEGVSLETLRDKYGFSPPQRFIYGDKFPRLMHFINSHETKRLY